MLEKLKRKVEGAEVYEIRSRETPVRFRAGELESAKSVERAGRALRIIKNGRLGYSTTTDLEDPQSLIENALASAEFGDPAPFRFATKAKPPEVRCFDPAVERLELERMIRMGEEVVDKIRAYNPELHIEVGLSRAVEELSLVTTEGQELRERGTFFALSVEAQRTEEGDILIVYDEAASRSLKEVDHDQVADSLITTLRWCERLARPPTKEMPVLFTPRGAIVLLLPLMVGLSGKSVFLGTSPLKGKLGERAFARDFTLVDDGTVPFAPRSSRFDDEGVPTSKRALIDRGEVRQFLYDLKTAGVAKAESTGNGFKSGLLSGRDFKNPPGIVPTTWTVSPGGESFEQLLSGLKEGLIVDQVLGLGQGNITSGEFSNNVAVGFYVRDGEIFGRVKNTMIAGNSYELLRERLIGLGSEVKWAYGFFRAPPILIDGVGVVSR
ncbi:MAG: TldD/PmbA family protein [Candidatus Acetothermia bacterium]|jgi:PmbA protein|nr:TldD/PmbA family protein [Candidatus Acetothermia bacterium]MDH7505820.1 TldD/PmbA family protein [Candidatus Acetothermia bacterium]